MVRWIGCRKASPRKQQRGPSPHDALGCAPPTRHRFHFLNCNSLKHVVSRFQKCAMIFIKLNVL